MDNTRGIRRAGSAALDLCYTARGVFDGYYEFNLSPWDIAAGAVIAREAGAFVCDHCTDSVLDLYSGFIMASSRGLGSELHKLILNN